MPRRVPPPIVAAVVPPVLPSPLVQRLRQDWRWAGISQFVWTFADAFGLSDWDIEALEHDMDGPEDNVLPELIAKLLYALTWNRQINRDNAFEQLHKQWLKREPDTNPFGSLEEPILWGTLGLSQKVEVLWRLCEWQLAEPARLRSLLKTEDDPASWRVDPIGWDKVGNTYFLFDDNRLWVQRARPQPPRPPKTTSLKAKRVQRAVNRSKPPKRSHKKKTPVKDDSPQPEPAPEPVSGPRKRTQVQFYGNVTPTVEALKRGGQPNTSPRSDRATRSSARHAPAPVTPSKAPSRPPPLPRGTRVSRRLRSVDDEWQQIPDDWLEGEARPAPKSKAKSMQDDGEESELSDLTDEEEHQAELVVARGEQESEAAREESPLSEAPEEDMPLDVPKDAGDDTDYKPDSENEDAEPSSEAGDEASVTPTAVEEENEEVPGKGTSPEPAQGEPTLETDDEPKPEAEDESKAEAEDEEKAETNDEPTAETEVEPKAETENEPKVETDEDPKLESETDAVETDDVKLAVKEAGELPEGFVEWEAVCITLYEWKSWPEQFAKSRDPDEKALYKLLVNDVAPQIIEIKEQERLKQEAINNRKRSSRIATRELAREEEMRREQAHHDMEERMEKLRQEQTQKERQEAEHIAREQAREARLREREERIASREAAILARVQAESAEKERAERKRERRKRRRDGEEVSSSSDEESGSASRPRTRPQTPAKSAASSVKDGSNGQSWELKCEVCKLHGWNLSDDSDVVCCDDCGRWQHVKCHDHQDIAAGRGIRDWDKVDFRCKECEQRKHKRQRVDDGRPLPPVAHTNGISPALPRQTAGAVQAGAERRLSATQYPVPYPSHQAVPSAHGYHPSQQVHSAHQYQRPPNHPTQAANGPQSSNGYHGHPHAHLPPQASPQARYHPLPQAQMGQQVYPSHPAYPRSDYPTHHSPPAEYRRPEYANYPRDEQSTRAEYPRADYPPRPYPPPQRDYAPRQERYPYMEQHLVNGQGHAGHMPHGYPSAAHPHTSPPQQQYPPRASQSPQQPVLPYVKYTGEMSEQRRPMG